MAILGYNTVGGSFDSMGSGRMICSKFTLAAAGTLNELHGYFHDGGSPVSTIRLVIYKDVGGTGTPLPNATLVAYTSGILLNGGATTHAQQTGFSTALPAADYWIGARSDVAGGFFRGDSGSYLGYDGAADPPPSPFGTSGTTQSGSHKLSCWAVVGAAATPPVANFTGTPTSGTASLSVTFTDSSTNTPTSWAWTFGDGGTSSSQNPSHSYTTSGVYTVALVATNGSGSDTKTRTAYITVGETISYAAGGGVFIY